jgi:hypothetical protein
MSQLEAIREDKQTRHGHVASVIRIVAVFLSWAGKAVDAFPCKACRYRGVGETFETTQPIIVHSITIPRDDIEMPQDIIVGRENR